MRHFLAVLIALTLAAPARAAELKTGDLVNLPVMFDPGQSFELRVSYRSEVRNRGGAPVIKSMNKVFRLDIADWTKDGLSVRFSLRTVSGPNARDYGQLTLLVRNAATRPFLMLETDKRGFPLRLADRTALQTKLDFLLSNAGAGPGAQRMLAAMQKLFDGLMRAEDTVLISALLPELSLWAKMNGVSARIGEPVQSALSMPSPFGEASLEMQSEWRMLPGAPGLVVIEGADRLAPEAVRALMEAVIKMVAPNPKIAAEIHANLEEHGVSIDIEFRHEIDLETGIPRRARMIRALGFGTFISRRETLEIEVVELK